MSDVTEAVGIATNFLKEMYPEEKSKDLRLEEVVLTEDEMFWLITLSFLRSNSGSALELAVGTSTREYKQIKVNAQTGKVLQMVMRNAYGKSAQAY